ncbi:hypothetical protein GRAN_4565 [Granulicella sibirica]|uniref:Uncharacterized protein n=1 Tax=Granulicella sibirica TaxID=2479048 RepID=A0A4Q0SXW5_9BACT|nr:hypothetical protein GRAN_4565 [Granulicella sibirica]
MVLAANLASATVHAQDPVATLPKNYTVALDTPSIEVMRVHYGPHEKIPVHDHTSFATVFVYLNDSGPLRIDHAGENAASVTRPPTTKGAFRVSPAQTERHSIENLGDTSSDFLRVELKQSALAMKEPFRGKAPQSLGENQDSLEFTDIDLQIERIICTGHTACPIKVPATPSLLVALTPLSLATGDPEKKEKLEAGAIFWLNPAQGATIVPDPASPAHLLRILLPAAAGQ